MNAHSNRPGIVAISDDTLNRLGDQVSGGAIGPWVLGAIGATGSFSALVGKHALTYVKASRWGAAAANVVGRVCNRMTRSSVKYVIGIVKNGYVSTRNEYKYWAAVEQELTEGAGLAEAMEFAEGLGLLIV